MIDWTDTMPLVVADQESLVVNDEDANLSSSSRSAILAADERRSSTSDDSGYSNKSISPTDSVVHHQTAGSVR